MLKTLADKFVPHEDGLGDDAGGMLALFFQFGQLGLGQLDLFQAVAAHFQFGLEGAMGQVQLGQGFVLALHLFHEGHLFFLTGAVDLFHAVHFAHHGMVFARVFHLHELVLALLDAGGVVVDLHGEALLLFLQVGQLFHDAFALGVAGIEFGLQLVQLAGSGFQFLTHGKDGVVHFLQLDKLADLVKVDSGAHEVPPKERGDGQAGKGRPKARRRLRASGRRAAGGWRHAASFLLPGCDGPRRKDKVAYPAPYGI